MTMYPAYTAEAVLQEFAVRFFALLNEGYRERYRDYRMQSQIAMLPHIRQDNRGKILTQLDWAAKDPSDILSSSGKDATDEQLKRFFGQR